MTSMGRVLGATTLPLTGAIVLPRVSGNIIVQAAISVAAGLAVWGLLYSRRAHN